MNVKQIPAMVGRLVEHLSFFSALSVEDGQWVFQNPKEAISIFVDAIKSRATKVVVKLLGFVTTISVPAVPRFIAAEKFKPGETVDGVKISRNMGDNFRKFFLPKIESNVLAAEIRVHKLLRSSKDLGIRTEIGEEKEETTLGQLWEPLKLQGNGQDGVLLTNGWANIFYIRDIEGNLWAVYAYWFDGGWGLDANSVGYPSEWDADDQVCSR